MKLIPHHATGRARPTLAHPHDGHPPNPALMQRLAASIAACSIMIQASQPCLADQIDNFTPFLARPVAQVGRCCQPLAQPLASLAPPSPPPAARYNGPSTSPHHVSTAPRAEKAPVRAGAPIHQSRPLRHTNTLSLRCPMASKSCWLRTMRCQ